MPIITCPDCGQERTVARQPSPTASGRCTPCSRKATAGGFNAFPKAPPVDVTCDWCGAAYQLTGHRRSVYVYQRKRGITRRSMCSDCAKKEGINMRAPSPRERGVFLQVKK